VNLAKAKLDRIRALLALLELESQGSRDFDEAIDALFLLRGYHMPGSSPCYTTSVDAALKLIPAGCAPVIDWLRYFSDNHIYYECTIQMVGINQPEIGHAEAHTMALAICIAALRAHLHLEDG